MEIKLFDSELKVMEILWNKGEMKAKDLASVLAVTNDWKKSTSYTVIKKCVDKGIIQRKDWEFTCVPLITREEVQEYGTKELLNKYYKGSVVDLVTHLLGHGYTSKEDISSLRDMIVKYKSKG